MTSPDSNEPEGSPETLPKNAAVEPMPVAPKEAKQAAARQRATVNGYIALADRHRDARNWAGARAGYEEVLALDPTLQHIWIQLGHARKESGDHAAAEVAYREALKLDPADADGHLQLGHLFKIRNMIGPAIEFYSRALELDPGLGDAQAEISRLRGRIETAKPTAPKPGVPASRRYPRAAKPSDGKTLSIVFDVSDLMHYFRNARLPTGIQRVQIEVIRNAIEAGGNDVDYSIVCFTKETDFWIEIPPSLFRMLCRQAVVGGDHTAPDWLGLLAQLDAVLMSKQYYAFARGAVLLNLGTSWWLQNYFLNVRLAKSLYGIKYVPFVHDFIPVMAPEHCVSDLRQDFITWAIGAFDHADYFLVNSKATLADLQTVCKKLGYKPREAAVITLDADFRKTLAPEAIWDEVGDTTEYLNALGLEKGNYVLFVSTIESRKNHIAAFSVWLKLIKKRGMKNVPRLVCVGNPGWLNDAAWAKLNASDLLSEHVLMLSKISDAALAVLYQNCVCTLYPSSYEGWGLPVTEALCYGKVPVISNVSSLPEAGGPYAEYFDVESEKDLMEAVERIVYDEKYRTRREQKIAAEFSPRPWSAISAQIVGQLRDWWKSHLGGPVPELPPAYHGIWPLEAEMGVLHGLTSNTSNVLWAGLKSGEIYRNGPGWWWPEHWGCWIKSNGPAQVAFLLKDVANAPIEVFVGLRGVQGKPAVCTLKCDGARLASVQLGPEQDKVVALTLGSAPEVERLVVIEVTCDVTADFRANTGGVDFRSCGVGVRWIYVCRETDVLARMKMVEAIALADFKRLERRPPDSDFFLHT
ncbi:MAG TPA: glycosyltransferase [Rhizomicrobium sp.]|nr:glycosyltransferase [Rhizomicrobium sp.]